MPPLNSGMESSRRRFADFDVSHLKMGDLTNRNTNTPHQEMKKDSMNLQILCHISIGQIFRIHATRLITLNPEGTE